ncbi:GlxA family transcriptional regulator [Microvirga arabica]|uniref:GlxA family transcriptional regulator n=1 Tax=Microvirga arabica TaxID=1128671 RepID=UPI00193A02BE|nr:helix-turn-helix domain-containing protein [Microvirga arabica]MBM1173873.1 helix-turn-helix domain-containing protein [Microvirga arabica]
MSAVHVAVLAFEGVSLFQLTVPGVVFGATLAPPGFPRHDVRYCALAPGRIRSDLGLEIEVPDGLDAMRDADVIIVPAWSDPELRAPDALVEALQQAHARGKLIVGLCLGAFVLGDAGLLDGRKATTHWVAREAFARRFPTTDFRPDVLYVEDGNIVTSAGTVAAIDCCLNLVRERHGADVANRMARMLVTPPHRQGGQAQYIEKPIALLPCQSRLPDVLEWALEHLSEPLTVDTLADVARMSRRSFTRRFREATGTTVTKWLNAQRVDKAQQLLESTDLPVEHIAHEVGFGTPLSMRQQFAEQLGTSPSDYRRTFCNTRRAHP